MADFVFADDYHLGQNSTRRFYEQFLKGYIHKHNNLMGVIQGFSSLILYDETITEEIRESAEQIQSSAKVATELNREIMGASGCGRIEIATITLEDALPYWKAKCEEICAASGVPLTLTQHENIPPVPGDAAKLGELLFHLVRNAAESAGDFPHGSVAIDLFPPGEASPGSTVDLFIRNTSASIAPDSLQRLFIPFESTKGSGHFGIGLTTAAVLAGDMGIRLGLRCADGTMTAWAAIPTAG
jgi:signal transduction histidine kinase